MATVASTMAGWDAASSRPIRGLVSLKITATKALVVAQAPAGVGFNQLLTAANELEFAVPGLLDTDEVQGGQLAAADANLAIAYVKRSASSPAPKVRVGVMNVGAANAVPVNDPVVIDIVVA